MTLHHGGIAAAALRVRLPLKIGCRRRPCCFRFRFVDTVIGREQQVSVISLPWTLPSLGCLDLLQLLPVVIKSHVSQAGLHQFETVPGRGSGRGEEVVCVNDGGCQDG